MGRARHFRGAFGVPSTISLQVKSALKRILASGRPEMAEVAREMGMSERTLQRRITEEGTSFRQLMLAARGLCGTWHGVGFQDECRP